MTTMLEQDQQAWDEGFAAGEAGRSWIRHCPYRGASVEAWSWLSGWIEGDAKRRGFEFTRTCTGATRTNTDQGEA
jgi:ribosome modulation factor